MKLLTPSAHRDTFTRDHLPPVEQWPAFVFDLPGLRYPARLNCAYELLDRTAGRVGHHRPCLYDEAGGVWSYGEVLDRVDRVARVLVTDLGLVPGNRVMLRGPNTPDLVVCWLAVVKAGGVVVTTMPQLRATELRTIGDIARINLALCDERFTEDLVRADLPGVPVVTFGRGAGGELWHRAARHPARFGAVATAADDVALLAFTSGTTGRPKATVHFHRDVLAVADTFSAHILRPRPDDVFAGSPPVAFTFGLGGLVVFPMRVGASAVLIERASVTELFTAVERHRVSVLFTAPTAYRTVLRDLPDVRLGSLRRAVSAGEALPGGTSDAFHDATGLRLVDGIGSTEMLHVFISAPPERARPGATGLPVPGYAARVLDDEGRPVPDGEPGRLAVVGPTGCRYLADERQRGYVRHGWNITGDRYVRDGDGYFWYQARNDDMIISSGYNIAGPEVEQALLRHPSVVDCAVVGAPDPVRGTIVKAYVVLAPGVVPSPARAGELQDFVKREIAPYKYPRAVSFVTSLPRTTTGKLQRFRLRETGGDLAQAG